MAITITWFGCDLFPNGPYVESLGFNVLMFGGENLKRAAYRRSLGPCGYALNRD
jgi:hypothetical protein